MNFNLKYSQMENILTCDYSLNQKTFCYHCLTLRVPKILAKLSAQPELCLIYYVGPLVGPPERLQNCSHNLFHSWCIAGLNAEILHIFTIIQY